MSFGRKILNAAYPFYRSMIYIKLDKITICLPILKLSAVNMQINDIYIITSLSELDIKDEKNRLNILDYQLIESDNEFTNQLQLLKNFIQEQFSEEVEYVKFKINERVYMMNNQNINASII